MEIENGADQAARIDTAFRLMRDHLRKPGAIDHEDQQRRAATANYLNSMVQKGTMAEKIKLYRLIVAEDPYEVGASFSLLR